MELNEHGFPQTPKGFKYSNDDLRRLGMTEAFETLAYGEDSFGDYKPPQAWLARMEQIGADRDATYVQDDRDRFYVATRALPHYTDNEAWPEDLPYIDRYLVERLGSLEVIADEIEELKSEVKSGKVWGDFSVEEAKELIAQLEKRLEYEKNETQQFIDSNSSKFSRDYSDIIVHSNKRADDELQGSTGIVLPDFKDSPVKDAKVKAPRPADTGFNDAKEVEGSLPPGVSLGASGYGGKYKRR